MSIKQMQELDKKLVVAETKCAKLEDAKTNNAIEFINSDINANLLRETDKKLNLEINLIKVEIGHLWRLFEIAKMTAFTEAAKNNERINL